MQRVKRQHATRRRGAALVETAIVLPVFFLVVLGIIEFGRAFMVMQLVNTAAREATRMAIVDDASNDEVTTFVKELVANTATVSQDKVGVSIDIAPCPGNPDPADQIKDAHKRDSITIDVSLPYADVSFVTPRFLTSASIRGSSTMRHE